MSAGGDITTYISENGDVLTSDNYNEVDGLVFSELSYGKFEEIEWTQAELDNLTVGTLAEKILENEGDDLTADKKAFLETISDSTRYGTLRVTNMEALQGKTYWDSGTEHIQDDNGQWAGITVDLGNDTSVVAFRGTNGTKLGWDEDLELGYDSDLTAAQRASKEYLEKCDAGNMYIAGHSKGGNDAEDGYLAANEATRERISRSDTYDSPGNNEELLEQYPEQYQELMSKQNNHFPKDSIIGQLLGDHPGGDPDYCNVDQKGHLFSFLKIGQHDPYAWCIDTTAGCFEKGEQSFFSKMFNNIADTITGLTPHGLTQYIVTLLESAGITVLLDNDKSLFEKLRRLWIGSLFPGAGLIDDAIQEALETLKDRINIAIDERKFAAAGDNIFMLDKAVIKSQITSLSAEKEAIDDQIHLLKDAAADLNGVQYLGIHVALDMLITNLKSERKKLGNLSDGLDNVLTQYVSAEDSIVAYLGYNR